MGDKVQHQRELLKAYRINLATYLRQQEHRPADQLLPIRVNGLDDTRRNIQRIKGMLRGWGAEVDDLPEEAINDE